MILDLDFFRGGPVKTTPCINITPLAALYRNKDLEAPLIEAWSKSTRRWLSKPKCISEVAERNRVRMSKMDLIICWRKSPLNGDKQEYILIFQWHVLEIGMKGIFFTTPNLPGQSRQNNLRHGEPHFGSCQELVALLQQERHHRQVGPAEWPIQWRSTQSTLRSWAAKQQKTSWKWWSSQER